MYLKELEYMVKLAEEKNLTRAAEKLFITPSALTQQLMKLEEDVGTPLFLRSRSGWSLTEAGEVYLAAAREILRLKHETYKKLQDIAETKKGTLTVGFPPERGARMFAGIYPAFHAQYPDITIQIKELSVRQQQTMIADGRLDIGFMTLTDNQKTEDIYMNLRSEEILLAVPSDHPACKQLSISEHADLSLLKDMPFATIYKESTARRLMDDIFRQSNFTPEIIFESARFQTILDIVNQGLCCGLVSSYYTGLSYPDVAYFHLAGEPQWQLCASYKRGAYLSEAARYMIRLITELY